MKSVVKPKSLIAGLACMIVLTTRVVAMGDAPTSSTAELVRAEMIREGGRFFDEESAEVFIKQYGKEAVAVEIAMLNEDISPYIKGKICFYLGKYLDDSGSTHTAVRPIIRLIEKAADRPVGKGEEFMISFAMDGLGFTGDDEALAFLKKLASEEYWGKYLLQPFGNPGAQHGTEAKFLKSLRENALRGLGLAGKQKAIDILEDLRSGEASDLAPKVDIWINHAEKRISGEYLEERKNPKVMP